MSTAERTAQSGPTPAIVAKPIPRLQNGDRLTRVEFERRYNAMPDLKKAELIEGIVYMPSPVRFTHHAEPHATILGWLNYYRSKAPPIRIGDNATSRLDEDNEPQPDAVLLLPGHMGGTSRIDEVGYISGAPDLVCEVAASSVSIDMHAKLNAYRRNGVREYLVLRTEDEEVDWFDLVDGQYQSKRLDEKGWLRSKLFPGLWLDPVALLAGDLPKLFAAVDEGAKTDDHRAFVQKLQQPVQKPEQSS